MKVAGFFKALNMSSSGLSHQRQKLDAIAANIANANTTRTEEGGPYQRKIVISKLNKQADFKTVLNNRKLQMTTSNARHINPGLSRRHVSGKSLQVESEITNDQSPYKKK